MSADILFSPATETDIPELVDLVNRAYRGKASQQGWTTEAHLLDGQRTDADDLREALATPGVTILLARKVAGQLLACVYLKNQCPDLYLGMLSVDPEQQSFGLGKRLLAAAEQQARQLACSAILISVISVRTELLSWYERLGFRRTGETQPFPTDTRFGIPRQPLELILLRKPLKPESSNPVPLLA